jgi:peroxiredoxin
VLLAHFAQEMDAHMTHPSSRPLQPGDPAPDFMLPAVQTDNVVSLLDYRGRSPLFLALFRGLYCPFCRRAIAHMAGSAEKLKPLGFESLAVVATDLENARLYYRFRPMHVPLAVDPSLSTHRSYGVPRLEVTPELAQAIQSVRVDADGELPVRVSLEEAARALDSLDGFQPTAADQHDQHRQFPQLQGQFLTDRDGIVRWMNLECSREGPSGMGKFPSYDELQAAAQIAVSA